MMTYVILRVTTVASSPIQGTARAWVHASSEIDLPAGLTSYWPITTWTLGVVLKGECTHTLGSCLQMDPKQLELLWPLGLLRNARRGYSRVCPLGPVFSCICRVIQRSFRDQFSIWTVVLYIQLYVFIRPSGHCCYFFTIHFWRNAESDMLECCQTVHPLRSTDRVYKITEVDTTEWRKWDCIMICMCIFFTC